MPDLTPMTRQEKFLNGDTDLEPITRREHFYAGREGELPEGSQDPQTREEWFIKKYRGGGGGDITVESLSVTSNGTYTAPSGKAYSPVEVNVPLPQNAYLNKSLSGLPADIATFNDGKPLPLSNLKVGIEAVQSGSGDPSPSNPRSISGWSSVNVAVSPLNINPIYRGQIYGDGTWVYNDARLTNVQSAQSNIYFLKAGTYTLAFDKLNSSAPNLIECSLLTKDSNFNIVENFASAWQSLPFTFTLTQDGYLYFTVRKDADIILNPSDYKVKILGQTYTIALGDTYYGGYIDWANNCFVATDKGIDLGNFSAESWTRNGVQLFWAHTIDGMAEGTANVMCSEYKYVSKSWTTLVDYEFGVFSNSIRLHNENVSTKEELANSLDGVQLVYELATPITIPLQLPQVKTLEGVNNIFADSGQVQELSYFSK